ncbi:unnamed protein product [Mytilus coruscus]|uniref:C-type lectin domain-containing protein n=1 Tax=Mytilus coruscus TaxID=42192 RepID=A0A6J8C8S0_MYTCO|nr:unnamed protein product [Mytilus coruscus]
MSNNCYSTVDYAIVSDSLLSSVKYFKTNNSKNLLVDALIRENVKRDVIDLKLQTCKEDQCWVEEYTLKLTNILEDISTAACKTIIKPYKLKKKNTNKHGKYPNGKQSFVIALHKSGDPNDLNNYRDTVCSSNFSKTPQKRGSSGGTTTTMQTRSKRAKKDNKDENPVETEASVVICGGRPSPAPVPASNAISGNTISNMWIGAHDIGHEGTWRWIYDNTTVNYANWGLGEPSNRDRNENCAEMWEAASYRWNDRVCTSVLQYICEKQMPA